MFKNLIIENLLKIENWKLKIKIFGIFLILVFSLLIFSNIDAASLYFSPSSGSYTVGSNFSVSVFVSSPDQLMNAAGGDISFPRDKIEITSLSKSGSIITFWAQEPVFSNTAGTVNFEGVVLPDGFRGGAGRIITLNFRAKTVGIVPLKFSKGSVLAHDGRGTNILRALGAASYTLTVREIISPEEEYVPLPTVPTQAPAAPTISSPTHSDPNKWYSNNSPEFSWDLTPDIIGVRLLFNDKPGSIPTITYVPPISERTLEDSEDGIWYFHIRFQNQYGWGATTHRKVLIDTEPPEPFEVAVDNEDDPTNPTPIFVFETTDLLSGIAHYEVVLNGKLYTTVSPQDIKDEFYKPSPLMPGKYELTVRAYDKAGNYTSAATKFEISPIKGLEIIKIPKRIDVGEILVIKGRGEPEITARIYIQKSGEEPILAKIKTGPDGNFVLEYDRILAKGDYFVSAQAEDEKGALSLPTQKYLLKVGLPPFLQFGKIVLDYFTTIITLFILIIGILLVIFYSWHRIVLWRKKLRIETKEVSQSVLSAFRALRDEVEEQIEYLDGKPGLNKNEKKVRDKLKEALNISEKFIDKEIKDIEKELK